MSDQQLGLFPAGKPIAPLRALTDRQTQIYAMICAQPSGVEPIELGALLHAQSGRHHADELCQFCGQDGARAIREKAIRQRLVRHGSVYEPRSDSDWTGRAETAAPDSQMVYIDGADDDGSLHYMLTGEPEPRVA